MGLGFRALGCRGSAGFRVQIIKVWGCKVRGLRSLKFGASRFQRSLPIGFMVLEVLGARLGFRTMSVAMMASLVRKCLLTCIECLKAAPACHRTQTCVPFFSVAPRKLFQRKPRTVQKHLAGPNLQTQELPNDTINTKRNPKNSIGNSLGPYSTDSRTPV